MKTVHIEILDKGSVEQGLSELREVKREWEQKANKLCETVAAMIAEEISKNFSEISMSDDLKDISTHTPTPGFPILGTEARGNTVYIGGQEIVFVEFGAGIYHNGNGQKNPLADMVSFDTDIGSYGQGQGNKKYWFVAHNLISCGTPAYMPIYKGIEAVKPQIPTIAREIFV